MKLHRLTLFTVFLLMDSVTLLAQEEIVEQVEKTEIDEPAAAEVVITKT